MNSKNRTEKLLVRKKTTKQWFNIGNRLEKYTKIYETHDRKYLISLFSNNKNVSFHRLIKHPIKYTGTERLVNTMVLYTFSVCGSNSVRKNRS